MRLNAYVFHEDQAPVASHKYPKLECSLRNVKRKGEGQGNWLAGRRDQRTDGRSEEWRTRKQGTAG